MLQCVNCFCLENIQRSEKKNLIKSDKLKFRVYISQIWQFFLMVFLIYFVGYFACGHPNDIFSSVNLIMAAKSYMLKNTRVFSACDSLSEDLRAPYWFQTVGVFEIKYTYFEIFIRTLLFQSEDTEFAKRFIRTVAEKEKKIAERQQLKNSQ